MAGPATSNVRRFFTSNVLIAIASLFIATVIWMISKLDEVETETLSVSINYRNEPNNCDIRLEPSSIEVRVQYQKGFKDKVNSNNIKAYLNLFNDDSIAGINEFNPTPRTIILQNIQVTEASDFVRPIEIVGDGSVNVRARKITELARVIPNIVGEPAEGFEITDEPTVEPDQVRLTAAREVLNSLVASSGGTIRIQTDPVVVEGEMHNRYATVGVQLPENTRLANPDQDEFNVNVTIAEKFGVRSIDSVPITYRPFEKGLAARSEPTSATVTIEAPLSLLKALNSSDFEVIPKQYITETEGARTLAAVEAIFSDSVDLTRREKISILNVKPEAIVIEIYRKE